MTSCGVKDDKAKEFCKTVADDGVTLTDLCECDPNDLVGYGIPKLKANSILKKIKEAVGTET